jgi:putative FmdB family regulatory protein
MPTYVYKCSKCGQIFEITQSIKESLSKPTNNCPACHIVLSDIIIQPPAIHFKGTGFYETDYKKKG